MPLVTETAEATNFAPDKKQQQQREREETNEEQQAPIYLIQSLQSHRKKTRYYIMKVRPCSMWTIGLRLALLLSLSAYVFRSVRSDYSDGSGDNELPTRSPAINRLKVVTGQRRLQQRKDKVEANVAAAKMRAKQKEESQKQQQLQEQQQQQQEGNEQDQGPIDQQQQQQQEDDTNDSSPQQQQQQQQQQEENAPIDPIFEQKGWNIEHYFNDHVVNDEKSIRSLQDRLEMGQVVIIPDAFDYEFAEAMHAALWSANYTLEEGYHADGYTHIFHTIRDPSHTPPFVRQAYDMFSSIDSRTFLTRFTDLDCLGDTVIEPTYHAPGNFENPHTADEEQHNVAFLWLLSKDWQPEWGGALYWCQETPEFSYVHATTFNTLVLFKVTTHSKHMITQVSRHVAGGKKRLAFNGFWTGGWVPEPEDDLEEQLEQNGDKLTRRQFQTIEEILDDPALLHEERRRKVRELFEEEYENRFPKPRYIFEIDANNPSTVVGVEEEEQQNSGVSNKGESQ